MTDPTPIPVPVRRLPVMIEPQPQRVLIRPFFPSNQAHAERIVARILGMPEPNVQDELIRVQAEFGDRHEQIDAFFDERFEHVRSLLPIDAGLSAARKRLLGAYFSSEYALESAALFNPSIVPHPDQEGVPQGGLRFVLSLRSIGEGHLSSIQFRSGWIAADGTPTLEPCNRFVTEPKLVPHAAYDHTCFQQKLREIGIQDAFTNQVMDGLGETFIRPELEARIETLLRTERRRTGHLNFSLRGIRLLADSNAEVQFPSDCPLSERALFPVASSQRNGLEDARFVRFIDEDGQATYYATYTAYDGRIVAPQLLETRDFLHFRFITLNGPAASNKGLALFPRRINGRYVMLARQDNENIYLMSSDNVHFWYTTEPLMKPAAPWQYVQIGNCGSPIETDAGWLVMIHGVGPMRKYCIGAVLLDLEKPSRVLARLPHPLLSPNANEREGYVPNVVYSCGSLLHGEHLIIPYGVADHATTFATCRLADLLAAMKPV